MPGIGVVADQLGYRRKWLTKALNLAQITSAQFACLDELLGNASAHEMVLVLLTRNPRFEKFTLEDMHV